MLAGAASLALSFPAHQRMGLLARRFSCNYHFSILPTPILRASIPCCAMCRPRCPAVGRGLWATTAAASRPSPVSPAGGLPPIAVRWRRACSASTASRMRPPRPIPCTTSPSPTTAMRWPCGAIWAWKKIGRGVTKPCPAASRSACRLPARSGSVPDMLVMDEPTNHVDVPTREAITAALARFKGVGLLISHDRALLDALCSQCLVHGGRSGDGAARRLQPGARAGAARAGNGRPPARSGEA